MYGDLKDFEAQEDHGPLVPVSTYGASKLAGEALIASYCAMFDLRACAFRFGNVVGPRQTHGVGFDFIRRLRAQPDRLRILGDGRQSKSYIHVEDVVDAVLMAHRASQRLSGPFFEVYNVATGDYITVTEIAELAIEVAGLAPGSSAPGIHGRRSRLEGRRAGGAAQHRPHSRAGLDLQAQHPSGALPGAELDARQRSIREALDRRCGAPCSLIAMAW